MAKKKQHLKCRILFDFICIGESILWRPLPIGKVIWNCTQSLRFNRKKSIDGWKLRRVLKKNSSNSQIMLTSHRHRSSIQITCIHMQPCTRLKIDRQRCKWNCQAIALSKYEKKTWQISKIYSNDWMRTRRCQITNSSSFLYSLNRISLLLSTRLNMTSEIYHF